MHLICLKGNGFKETLTPAWHKTTVKRPTAPPPGIQTHILQLCAGELWGCKHCTFTTNVSTYIASNRLNGKLPHAATVTWLKGTDKLAKNKKKRCSGNISGKQRHCVTTSIHVILVHAFQLSDLGEGFTNFLAPNPVVGLWKCDR